VDPDFEVFDLLIEKHPLGYRARVLSSPVGNQTADLELPVTEIQLDDFLHRIGRPRHPTRRVGLSISEETRKFGAELLKFLFPDKIASCFERSRIAASGRNRGLRIQIRLSEVPELCDLPWEFLYHDEDGFLALSTQTPVVRYLEIKQPVRPLSLRYPLRILVVISSPSNLPRLDVDHEWENLRAALSDIESKGFVQIERLAVPQLARLNRRLRLDQFHILHFIGHGDFDETRGIGTLYFEDDRTRSTAVSAQQLATALHDHPSIRLVVLNACEGARHSRTDPFTGTAQTLIRSGVPAVIAMQFEVTDNAAVTFASELYTSMAFGDSVERGLSEARKAIYLDGNELEWATPVLYLRSPDSHIFSILPTEVTAEAAGAAERLHAEAVAQRAEQLRKSREVEEAARLAGERQEAEAARLIEEARHAEEQHRAESARLAEERRKAQEQAAEARRTEETRKAEAAKLAEEQRKTEEAGLAVKAITTVDALIEEDSNSERATQTKPHTIKNVTLSKRWYRHSFVLVVLACALALPTLSYLFEVPKYLYLGWYLTLKTEISGLTDRSQLAAIKGQNPKLAPDVDARIAQLEKIDADNEQKLRAEIDGSTDRQRLAEIKSQNPKLALDVDVRVEQLDQIDRMAELRRLAEIKRQNDARTAPLDKIDAENAQRLTDYKPSDHSSQPEDLPRGSQIVLQPEQDQYCGGRISLASSLDFRFLAVSTHSAEIKLWDIGSGKLLRSLKDPKGPYTPGFCETNQLTLSANGERLLTDSDKTALLFDTKNGNILRHFFWGWTELDCVAMSPDARIVIGCLDKQIKITDALTGKPVKTLKDDASYAAFSGDSLKLATTGSDANGSEYSISVWDLGTSKRLQFLQARSKNISSLAFVPGSDKLASGEDKTIRIWHLNDGHFDILEGHTGPINSILVSNDGQYLISGSDDGTLKLWSLSTLNVVRTFDHGAKVSAVTFAPNGNIISGGSDNLLRLWNSHDGNLIATLVSNGDDWAIIGNDGRFVAGGNPRNLLKIVKDNVDLPTEDFIATHQRGSFAEVLSVGTLK
jgi:WD40 repeat protein